MPPPRAAAPDAGDRAAPGGTVPEGAGDRREYGDHSLRAVIGGRLGRVFFRRRERLILRNAAVDWDGWQSAGRESGSACRMR